MESAKMHDVLQQAKKKKLRRLPQKSGKQRQTSIIFMIEPLTIGDFLLGKK